MKITQYLEWHFLPFLIPFLFCAVMLFLTLLSGLDHGHNHDGNTGHDHDLDYDSIIWQGLEFFGVGSMPLTTLLLAAGLVWGVSGYLANMFFQQLLSVPLAFTAALSAALIITLTFAHLFSRLFVRLFPLRAEGARKELSLIGELGLAQSTITTESGTAVIRSGGDTFRVSCRINAGEREIRPGQRLQLISYEPESNIFYAQCVPAETLPKQKIELLERS